MRTFEDYNSGISLAGKKTGGFRIAGLKLTSLFGGPDIVQGECNIDRNDLTSLEYGPTKVTGDFTCKMNELESLKFGPRAVGGEYNCSTNPIASLEGAPTTCRSFNCSNTDITSLEFAPIKILDTFYADNTSIESLEYAPTQAGRIFSVMGCTKLKNPKSQIIQLQIKADKYFTDEGNFTFATIEEEFNKVNMAKKNYKTINEKIIRVR